jgi:c-di-GMP-binding flagellar brake protein YcgR
MVFGFGISGSGFYGMIEKRKYIRFLPKEKAYAAIGADFAKVGKLKDISIGGLALEYITDEKSGLAYSQVDIFVRGKEFHLFKLPCKIVYDIRLDAPEKVQALASTLLRRRCGVEFDWITKKHKKQLEEFLRIHTVGVIENHF